VLDLVLQANKSFVHVFQDLWADRT